MKKLLIATMLFALVGCARYPVNHVQRVKHFKHADKVWVLTSRSQGFWTLTPPGEYKAGDVFPEDKLPK